MIYSMNLVGLAVHQVCTGMRFLLCVVIIRLWASIK